MRELKQGSNPTSGPLSELEENHLRLRVKQLISGSLNGVRIRQSLPQPNTQCAETRVSGKESWEPEFRDCGAIPLRGLLLTAER